MARWFRSIWKNGLLLAVGSGFLNPGLVSLKAQSPAASRFLDHSLLVSPDYPCTWPSHPFPRFSIQHQRKIGPDSPYHVDSLIIDGNTGTQIDVPPHSVARPDLKREKSGPLGLATTDRIEVWQLGGEACVVDVRELLDRAPKGVSPLVLPDHVRRFEKDHRPVGFGDVVLFRSDYSDKYYRPFPEGNRFIADILDGKAPGYPDPNPECMEYLGKKGVMALGTDSASMGPLPTLAEPTHYAGLKYGMIWTEGATALGQLPPTGAFYCNLFPRHKDGPYGAGRAFSIVGGDLPARLVDSCKNKRAIDLSPTLAQGLPLTNLGVSTGGHRQVYLKLDFLYSDYLDMWHHGHLMDSMAGTHLVPPSYALPPKAVEPEYSPEVRSWLAEYEKKFGKRGSSDLTTDKVPLSWTCGPTRVIDVRTLAGSTGRAAWPQSPTITAAWLKDYEAKVGPIQPGEVVLFFTGYNDRFFQKPIDPKSAAVQEANKAMWVDPLQGKVEGWPALGPDAVMHLAEKGVRCVGSDAPDLGGVDPKQALMTYWALGSKNMVGVELLVNLEKIHGKSYFLFAPLKIKDCHGGPGRAIVLY